MNTTALQAVQSYEPNRFLRYDELSHLVHGFATAYPALCSAASIGKSPEGRDIWALTLTNQATGAAQTKPALLLEGNIHAGEVTGSACALATVKRLLTEYGSVDSITHLLDTSTIYVIPCLSVDGAEFYLTTPHMVRSSPLPYPEVSLEREGLMVDDVDGDGRIRMMRVKDPLGEWKVSELDPRIMVKRQPEDVGLGAGPFFRLYPEGYLALPAGRQAQGIKVVRPNRGLDFNRNFPAHWNPEAKQPGAGQYPLDQPETRALADFMLSHSNISIYVALHTYGGVLLRPPSVAGEESMNLSDLRLFQALGDLCERVTTYPCRSSYHAFFHTPGQAMTKGSKDWAYDHLGLVAYTMELWDLDARAGSLGYREAGIKGLMKLSEAERAQDELKRLQWNDRELDGKGFLPWTPFEHPQLGQVEIGGWDEKSVRQNTPPHLLPEEAERVSSFVAKLGLTLPKLAMGQTRVTRLEGGAWRVEAEVVNSGFLSTNTTKTAISMKQAKPVEVSLDLPQGGVLLAGAQRQELGHLDGFSAAQDAVFYGAPGAVKSTSWAEWVLYAPEGAELTLTAACPRGGSASITMQLKE